MKNIKLKDKLQEKYLKNILSTYFCKQTCNKETQYVVKPYFDQSILRVRHLQCSNLDLNVHYTRLLQLLVIKSNHTVDTC